MIYIFFTVPSFLVFLILIGLVGVGIQIASTVIFWILVILFAGFWIV